MVLIICSPAGRVEKLNGAKAAVSAPPPSQFPADHFAKTGSGQNEENSIQGPFVQFEFVDGLVGELHEQFPEMWFHFGGDETDTRCWGPPPVRLSTYI
jgi:N-acetyl-beta-hexosaminidase